MSIILVKVQDTITFLKRWTQDSNVGDSRSIHIKSNSGILLFFPALISSGLNLVPSFENNEVCEFALDTLKVLNNFACVIYMIAV